MTQTKPTPMPTGAKQPSIQFDLEDWMPYLENREVSEEEKLKLIEILWDIVLGFVDLGWDVAPAQKNSGQNIDLTAVLRAAVLSSENTPANHKERV